MKEDYNYSYEHYRVPSGSVDGVPRTWCPFGFGTQWGIEAAALRFSDDYRAEFLIPPDQRSDDGPVYRPGYEPNTHGGKTICKMWLDGKVVVEATAWCSINDVFSYRTGRRIARGRVEKKLQELKEEGHDKN